MGEACVVSRPFPSNIEMDQKVGCAHDGFAGKRFISDQSLILSSESQWRPNVSNPALIELRDVSKRYRRPDGPSFDALKSVTCAIPASSMTAIVGRSGSGKSTLLHLIAGLDHPSAGSVDVSGVSLGALSEDRLAKWRGSQVGVVFQFFQLLPTLTILENILLAMDFVGTVAARDRRSRALALLDRVGIADQAGKLPGTLSGGQQQRAAIARAIANDPKLLVADEPTGNLDTDSAATVMGLLTSLADDGRAVIVVTHDDGVAARADRIIRLSDGMIVEDTAGEHAAKAAVQ